MVRHVCVCILVCTHLCPKCIVYMNVYMCIHIYVLCTYMFVQMCVFVYQQTPHYLAED